MNDPHFHERAAATAGKRIQANRGSREEPHWVTLDGMPEFTCDADLYRVHPDEERTLGAGGEALLPCPFCGGAAERIDFGPGDIENEGGSCIACTACQASGPVEFGRKENLISNWNRRALATGSAACCLTAGFSELARLALPFLHDEAAKYDDDGSNEPLELARKIEAALASCARPAEGTAR